MTARTSGGLISHLSDKVGGYPFCGSKFACSSVTPHDTMGYQICKRCAKRQEKRMEVKARREAKAS